MLKKIICILMIANSLYSQGKKGLYTYALTGYKMGSVYTSFPNEYLVNENNISNAYIRLGGGNTITGAIGSMIHQNFGMEVSGTYTYGASKLISNFNPIFTNYKKEIQSKNFHFVGSLVMQTELFSMLKLYVKAGVVISVLNQSNIYTSFIQNNELNENEYQNQGEIMKGFNGSLGILYPIAKKTFLMIEAEEVSVQGSFKSADLLLNRTNFTLPNQVYFTENIGGYNSAQYQKKYPVSYSCIGVNIGVLYSF